ncbi:fungal-specific transcription factor domain-containing protein [Halenospora varia]|nr:fungal-specific transcription factor domain-containing protein [Halenospora varia]
METSGAKRRRISLACSACRTRKSRCDGARPKCSACNDLSFNCVYVQSPSSANAIIGKDYLSSIEERLKLVEQNVSALQASQARPRRRLAFADEAESDDSCHESLQGVSGVWHESPKNRTGGNSQEVVTLEDETDGIGGVIFGVEQDCGFFGPSSNIALNRHICRAAAQLSCTVQCWSNTSENESQRLQSEIGVMYASRPSSPSGHRVARKGTRSQNKHLTDICSLPSEERTCELISQYFQDTGLLFPYIHEGSFWETYENMRSSNFRRMRRSWLGLLNMVMALATSTTINAESSAETRARESNVYYKRAMALCEKQMMRGTSLEIVQFLLLMGQYLQGTQRSVETWTIHGLAVKAALQLGLHSSKASKHLSPLIQEYRKRTWYGCVVLDRTLSMTFGRPAAIPDDYVIIDLPCYIDAGGASEPAEPRHEASVQFFNATIALYKIMWNVIKTSYDGNLGSDRHMSVVDNISRILQLEQQLVDWERQLPPVLALRDAAEIPPSPPAIDHVVSSLEKFRIILTLRHHNLRVLLHRPILVGLLDIKGNDSSQSGPQNSGFVQQIGSNSILICANSSTEIISLISTIVTSTGERRTWLGAWWFSLYYTFNAALVLFATILVIRTQNGSGSAFLSSSISVDDLQRSLVSAGMTLRQLDTRNRMIDRCAAYVEKIVMVLNMSFATPSSTMALVPLTNIPATANAQPGLSGDGNYTLNSDIFQTFPPAVETDASPLGMDLGEFMFEGDLEFWNQLVSTAATARGTNKVSEVNPASIHDNGEPLAE